MSENNAYYGRLITLLAAGSLLGACSPATTEGGRGSSSRLAERWLSAGDYT